GAVLRIPEIGSVVALQTGTGRCQQNRWPYDETNALRTRDCSAPGRVGFLLVSLLCRSKEE
ncbi:hypothetical protein, partial [Cupriavidus sp.]|uniref:hypothetical protein n=1 Tax=Cupriavidus sp. TaxID=1873897 RepID=UPI003D10FA94